MDKRGEKPLPPLLNKPLSTPIVFLLLVMTLIRSGLFIGMKVILDGLTPFLAAGARNLIGGIALTAYIAAQQRKWIRSSRAQIGAMAVMGGLLAFNFGIINIGLTYTTASRTTIILNAQPLFVAMLSKFFIRRGPIGVHRVLGLFICFLGILTVFVDKVSSHTFQTLRGDLLVFAGSIIWAVLAIMRKRVSQNVEPMAVATWETWVSTILLLASGWVFEGTERIHLTSPVIIALLYCGLLGSAFTFSANVYLLKNYEINAVSSFNFLIPVVGAILGIVILHEVFTVQLCIGGVLVALGIFLVNK